MNDRAWFPQGVDAGAATVEGNLEIAISISHQILISRGSMTHITHGEEKATWSHELKQIWCQALSRNEMTCTRCYYAYWVGYFNLGHSLTRGDFKTKRGATVFFHFGLGIANLKMSSTFQRTFQHLATPKMWVVGGLKKVLEICEKVWPLPVRGEGCS